MKKQIRGRTGKKNDRKKGITPLMATLLLISFAVALGVVIMNFGRAEMEAGAECTMEIGLGFSVIAGEEQFCLDRAKNELFFAVENGVNVKVNGMVVNLIGTKKALTYDLEDAQIEKAGTYLKYLSYPLEEVGEVRQIKIVPKVTLYEEELICQEKAIILESVKDC